MNPTTAPIHDHVWWLASRASGLVALGLITASVVLGLMMSGRIMRKPGRARTMVALHEQLALAGLFAIAVHGITLLGDAFLHPGLTGITIPGAIDYRPLWVGSGSAPATSPPRSASASTPARASARGCGGRPIG